MKPLTEDDIREAIVNVEPREIERLTLPGLHEVVWEDREYLGWRDPGSPQRGYIVFWDGDEPVGIMVRAATSTLRPGPAMCSLCQTAQPSDQVVLFSAPRVGAAGIKGDSVGTYICADLGCSFLIRMATGAHGTADPSIVVAHRAAGLSARLASFAGRVRAAA